MHAFVLVLLRVDLSMTLSFVRSDREGREVLVNDLVMSVRLSEKTVDGN